MKKNLMIAVVLTVFAVPCFAQGYMVLPEFASGNGWSTEIFLANQGLSAVTGIVLSFYDDKGAQVTVNSNIGNSAILGVPTLNPGATQVVQITSASTPAGYVVIRYPSSGITLITVNEVFRSQSGDLGVSQQIPANSFSFPVEVNSSAGINTGFAIANPTYDSNAALAQTAVATLISSGGTIQRTATVSLGVGGHIGKFVTELFPGLDNFIGSLSISSPLGVAVMADRLNEEGSFAAVSANSGPILGPFAVSGPTIAATAGTSPSSAQQIPNPALVTGYVGAAGGYYYFGFSGNQGDLVTVMTDTQGLNSYFDSVLYVTMSDGTTTIAENDQNGLSNYYDNDSFLQIVLPTSGTYYVVLTDYNQGGGSTYLYKLHFKLIPAGSF